MFTANIYCCIHYYAVKVFLNKPVPVYSILASPWEGDPYHIYTYVQHARVICRECDRADRQIWCGASLLKTAQPFDDGTTYFTVRISSALAPGEIKLCILGV